MRLKRPLAVQLAEWLRILGGYLLIYASRLRDAHRIPHSTAFPSVPRTSASENDYPVSGTWRGRSLDVREIATEGTAKIRRI